MSVSLRVVSYDDPIVETLTAEVQAEYAVRYEGDGDTSPIDASQFTEPNGIFLQATFGDSPAGMGGWRHGGVLPGDAEIKRMYVRPAFRRTGVARLLLAELERTAREAGAVRLILETGSKQPEAVALYRSAGYADVDSFGHYACHPLSVHMGKVLT